MSVQSLNLMMVSLIFFYPDHFIFGTCCRLCTALYIFEYALHCVYHLLYRIALRTIESSNMQTCSHKIYMLQCSKRPSADKVFGIFADGGLLFNFMCEHWALSHACTINRSIDILSAHNCDHISNGWQPHSQSNYLSPGLHLLILLLLLTFQLLLLSSLFTLVVVLLASSHRSHCNRTIRCVALHIWQAFKNLLSF